MGERDDELGLGLGLTLGCGGGGEGDEGQEKVKQPALRMNDLSFPCSAQLMQTKRAPWADLFQLRPDGRALGRGIDMNRLATAEFEADEATRVSSPNSAVSSVLSGKRSEREPVSDEAGAEAEAEAEAERASCSRGSDDEDGGAGGEDPSRKKLRLSKEQSLLLEQTFKEHNTLNPKQKLALAKQLNLRPRQVEVWFQNRRARTKLKQTEVDCEYLKRCCENLTEDNRRLQKEVHELRALKRSPQLYMHMNPPTTLTMCPSCERVAVSSASASSSAARSGQGRPTNHQGAAAINPWAAMQILHRPLNASGSRS